MDKSVTRTYILLVCTVSIWGASFVAAKYAVAELPPLVAAFFRFLLASACLCPVLAWREGKAGLPKVRDLPLMVLLALTGVVLYNYFFLNGSLSTSAINGSLIVANSPAISTGLSALLLKERVKPRQIAGLIISLAGVVLIITKGSMGFLVEMDFNHGDLLFVGGVFSWTLYTIASRVATRRLSPLSSTTYACVIGTVMLFPLAYPGLNFHSLSALTYKGFLGVAFLGVAASALSFVWWNEGLKKIGVSRAVTFHNLTPVTAAVLSVILLGERFHYFHLLGAVLVISGVYLSTKTEPSASRNAPATSRQSAGT